EGDEKRSYRFTPQAERLPEGLPGWFRDRDRDGDGQVAMHEYASSWSDRRAEEFARYDGDGDGFVSPSEALKR
ncbi:MAG: calcium sensor EFh, partial [Planctomycetota bacterium]